MDHPIQLFAVQTFERTRLTEIRFYTEWDDARVAAVHKEFADAPGFDYSAISEFEVPEDLLEDLSVDYSGALADIMEKSTIIKKHYFI